MEQAGPRVPGYELVAPLGTGGSATVWRARREADGLLLALKVVPVGRGGVTRAMREAAVLSRVRHQHLLHLYDVLPLPGDDGRPAAVALAVQLAEGGSLGQVLARRHHLSPGELVTVLGPVAGAVADLHRAGVVHGDLSPGNVLFTADGMPLLGDLGVCRVAGDSRGPLDATDGMVAPEVLEGFPPSADADVYGLGALAWTCLVGEPPGWVGSRPPLEEVAPDLPEALRHLVTSCLAPEPGDRPHAEEVAVALFAVAEPEPVEVAPDADPDPAAGLTRRIRERARADRGATEEDPGEERTRGRVLRRLHPRRRRTGPSAEPPAAPPAPPGRPRRLALVLVALSLAAAGVAAAAAWPRVPDDLSRVTATTAPPAQADPVPTSEVPAASTAPRRADVADTTERTASPTSAAEPAEAVVQELLDARARAWVRGDVAALSLAHATGSPALAQDAGDLATAVAGGYRYEGLGYQVNRLRQVEAEEGPGDPAYEVSVTRAAFRVVGPEGETESYPEETEEVRIELTEVDDAWRVWSWAPLR
jgi:hypothetical protein